MLPRLPAEQFGLLFLGKMIALVKLIFPPLLDKG
jgi:hypothetical protein